MRKRDGKRFRVLAVLLCMLLLCSCGGKEQDSEDESTEGRRKSKKSETQEMVGNQDSEVVGNQDSGAAGQEAETAQSEDDQTTGSTDEAAGSASTGTGTAAVKASPVIRVETVDCTSDYRKKLNFTASYDRFVVEGEGYEELKDAVENLNANVEESFCWEAEDYAYTVEEMLEDAEPGAYENMGFWLEYSGHVLRADTRIVNLSYNVSVFLGGAHPYDYTMSYNLNAATGEELSLHDIMADDEAYDELYEALIDELTRFSESSRDNELNPDYADTVYEIFYMEYSEPTWYYGEDALRFVFDPYVLAPYASGTIEAEVPLEKLRLVELPTADSSEEMREVHVSTVSELHDAIGSNTRIYLAPGVYDLSDGELDLDYNSHVDVYWGAFFIKSVSNLELIAENPKMRTQIVIQDAGQDVLTFERCRNLVLEGLTLGHAVEPGTCSGDVLEFDRCKKITLRGMDLYGCGAYGITAYNCNGLEMTESVIHDCTYGIMFTGGCQDFLFRDSMFLYCQEYNLLDGADSHLVFENCIFDKNRGEFLMEPYYYEGEPTKYEFRNCRFLSGEDADFENYIGEVIVTED